MPEFFAWRPSGDGYFGEGDDSAESFQKPWPHDISYKVVETSYFGFSIPEHQINGEIYHWAHPAFGVTSGGIFITRGVVTNQLDTPYSNWGVYMPLPVDMTDCTYPNGITVRMRKPLVEWTISYRDDETDTHLQLNLEAIMPPAFRPTGGHFTQAMRTSGELVLRGEHFDIDGFTTRDRSWGDKRSERKLDLPPAGWRVAVFSEDLAFHDFSFESPELEPALATRYPGYENGENLLWGYVWKYGRLLGVRSSQVRSTLGLRGVGPTDIELMLTDEEGETYELLGTVKAATPYAFWPNLSTFYCLTEWRYQDLVGYGDTQMGVWESFAVENLRP